MRIIGEGPSALLMVFQLEQQGFCSGFVQHLCCSCDGGEAVWAVISLFKMMSADR